MRNTVELLCAGYVVLGLHIYSVLVFQSVWTCEAMELCGIFLTFSLFQILLLLTLKLSLAN